MTTYAVCGAGGFIGGHFVNRLINLGHQVKACDVKPFNEWYQLHSEAENLHLDLTDKKQSDLAIANTDIVINLAADMGGMGFIASHPVECLETAQITLNVYRSAFEAGVNQVFYASSACVYPDGLQNTTQVSLKESDAWPAEPEPGYGLEKLYGEELGLFWNKQYGLDTRIARFHNIFGPNGTYSGGREKAPAALCRKVAEAKITGKTTIDIWGDGLQTRSFLYVDECIDGVLKLLDSTFKTPINIGSDELISINDLAYMVADIAGIEVQLTHNLSAPQGVRGRCSNNELIEKELQWRPTQPLRVGMEKTFKWVYDQVKNDLK